MSEGYENVHICSSGTLGYLPRVRWYGAHRYTVLGKPRKSLATAMAVLAKAMATGKYKRGDVLHCPPMDSYYEPHVMYEMVKQ